MPEHLQSTPTPAPRPLAVAVVPPIINPELWEEFPCFRETFLLLLTSRGPNKTFRSLGIILHAIVLEFGARYWPPQRDGNTRAEVKAAVADLRHLQGFLTTLGQAHIDFDLSPHEGHLSVFAGEKAAPEVGRIADALEAELGSWRDN